MPASTLAPEASERLVHDVRNIDSPVTVEELIELHQQLPRDLAVVGRSSLNSYDCFAPLRCLEIDTQELHEPDYGMPSRKVLYLGF